MTVIKGLVTVINDACRSVVVLLINAILNVAHEIIKFSLILFLVYYLGLWIFRFWDAVLDGSLPIISPVFSHIRAQKEVEATIALLEKLEKQTDLKELESDFEKFIKAELRDSQLGIKPRSSQFETRLGNSDQLNNQMAVGESTSEIETNVAITSVNANRQKTSEPTINLSQEELKTIPERMKAGTNLLIDKNMSNYSHHSIEEVVQIVKLNPLMRAEVKKSEPPPSFDEQTDHESFHRV